MMCLGPAPWLPTRSSGLYSGALLQRQAPAADAAVQALPHARHQGDALVEFVFELPGDALPVALRRVCARRAGRSTAP